MNLEINIKVPLGGTEVSVAQSVAAAQTTLETAHLVPAEAFPPALDPGRRIPWGEPQRPIPNEEYVVPVDAGPPSLEEMGVAFDPRADYGPPSLPELAAGAAVASVNGGVPPGLEGVDLPGAALMPGEPPPPPGIELDVEAAPAPQARSTKQPLGKHRRE